MKVEDLTLPKLDPEAAENICGALRSWAPILHDFYRAMLDLGAPESLASGVVLSFFETTLAAGYERAGLEDS